MSSTRTEPARIAATLRAGGLQLGVLPVWLPISILLQPTAAPSVLEQLQADLLAGIRRRVRHKRTAVVIETAGIATAWAGVLWSRGSLVTLIGIAAMAAGALLTLTGRDRLSSVDSGIVEAYRRHRTGLTEWLAILLEVGPYSYPRTAAAGLSKVGVLKGRLGVLPAEVVDGLADWLRHGTPEPDAAHRWRELRTQLRELGSVHDDGRQWQRRLELLLDRCHAGLLVALMVVAIVSASAGWPSAALATTASLIVLAARAAHEVTTSAIPDEPRDGFDSMRTAAARLGRLDEPADLTETDIDVLVSGWVLTRRRPR